MKRKEKEAEKQVRNMTNESHSDKNPLKSIKTSKPLIRETIYSNKSSSEKREGHE